MQYALKDCSLMNKEPLKLDSVSHSNGSDVIDTLKKTNYSIVDLLPQNNLAVVRNSKMALEILKMVYNVISLLADCLHKFYVSKEYLYFDPHVGENACQIRAYILFILAKTKSDSSAVIERINCLSFHLDKLKIILNTEMSYRNKGLTLVELLKKYGCHFSVTWQEYFLYESYFLTLFKKSNTKRIYICSDTLVDFLEISQTLSKKTMHKYQSQLAMISCEFIKIIAMQLNINKKNTPSIVSSISYDDDGRMVYPLFFSSRIIFMHMKKTRCTVLVILETIDNNDSRKDLILFDGGTARGRLLTPNNNSIKEDVCMVIIGTRIAALPLSSPELLKKLNYFGLYAILLMNAAAHKQFSGSRLISFANQLVADTTTLVATEKTIEEEFLALKSRAHNYGFCRDNPSMLLVKHIFMDRIGNQIGAQKNNNNYISVRDPVDI